ncbi:4Fe-4S dicluster domain-containing protein [candidate division KSB1 bacterium]|nr:4Fe-4S dicluster domain-containing protein [candidate division KSB1 bacterium]NIR71338.1 4Fe-4S dicluster domain-containing protein [candidate division KSB1 bacterium]NIS26228.1 4Fe-4S dicluster domain-containing protein [candidate division KSB1 bacterium]NIT74658.1 4Fe-4S dicluster domain-containing protein [candidate division KSB1 bacterium]NIU26876.1 4Fe-4S dicluster domain-containing protein [candidate division KSB1 bacterium]
MTANLRQDLKQKIRQTLTQDRQRHALLSAVKRGRDARSKALSELPHSESFQRDVRAVKKRCIAKIDELLSRFSEKAKARGAKIFFAKTGKDACDYVLNLAGEKNARVITKSKSLTTEEIELNHPLEAAGLQVIETDLGERIIQMAGELPYHLVFPAVHKTADQVAELFGRSTGEKVTSELKDIMALMRRTLRPIFLNADMGITGANVAIAETGAIIIETNEGNGRLVSSIPPVHVCIMGVEKIVESVDDALKMILAHPVSAVGQMLTTYVSFMAGRSALGNDERELHIVILDNGREEMRRDDWYRDALNCIRCGACMNICPTYGVLGGHVFGHIYPGPIGIPWTAQVHGLEQAAKFSDLCISCGLCKEICPAEIDIPLMITKVKYEALEIESQSLANRVLMASETFARFACATAPLSNWVLRSRPAKYFGEKIFGIDKRRSMPSFQRRSFKRRFKKSRKSVPDPARRVGFFVDYFANYVKPEIAESAMRFLEKAEVEVVLPNQKSSGYPYISYGELEKAKKVARFNVRQFYPYVAEGFDLITTEPTAAYALKHLYPKLLDYSDESRHVAQRTYEFFEYVIKLNQEGRLLIPPQITEGRKFGYHIPCHQRGLSSGHHTMGLLKALGYDVQIIETGTCCGMAGTFGLKTGSLGYELSTTVGEPLFELFKRSAVDAIITESGVCTMQLEEGTGMEILHPLELISSIQI